MKSEIKKILSRKSVQLLLLMILGFSVFSPVATIFNYSFDRVNQEGEIESYKGKTAIEEEKKTYQSIKGLLTVKKLQEAVAYYHSLTDEESGMKFMKMEAKYPGIYTLLHRSYAPVNVDDPKLLQTLHDAGQFYSNREAKIQEYLSLSYERQLFTDFDHKVILEKAQEIKAPFSYDFHEGWRKILDNLSFLQIFMAVAALFVGAGVFSHEKETDMQSIVTSMGRAVLQKVAGQKMEGRQCGISAFLSGDLRDHHRRVAVCLRQQRIQRTHTSLLQDVALHLPVYLFAGVLSAAAAAPFGRSFGGKYCTALRSDEIQCQQNHDFKRGVVSPPQQHHPGGISSGGG